MSHTRRKLEVRLYQVLPIAGERGELDPWRWASRLRVSVTAARSDTCNNKKTKTNKAHAHEESVTHKKRKGKRQSLEIGKVTQQIKFRNCIQNREQNTGRNIKDSFGLRVNMLNSPQSSKVSRWVCVCRVYYKFNHDHWNRSGSERCIFVLSTPVIINDQIAYKLLTLTELCVSLYNKRPHWCADVGQW